MATEADLERRYNETKFELDNYKREMNGYIDWYLSTVNLMERWAHGITDSTTPQQYADELRKVIGSRMPRESTTEKRDDQPGPEHRALAVVADAAEEVRSWHGCTGGELHTAISDVFERFGEEIKKAMHE